MTLMKLKPKKLSASPPTHGKLSSPCTSTQPTGLNLGADLKDLQASSLMAPMSSSLPLAKITLHRRLGMTSSLWVTAVLGLMKVIGTHKLALLANVDIRTVRNAISAGNSSHSRATLMARFTSKTRQLVGGCMAAVASNPPLRTRPPMVCQLKALAHPQSSEHC